MLRFLFWYMLLEENSNTKTGCHKRKQAKGIFYNGYIHYPGHGIQNQPKSIFYHEYHAVVGSKLGLAVSGTAHVGNQQGADAEHTAENTG